jgi:hypothetical protein
MVKRDNDVLRVIAVLREGGALCLACLVKETGIATAHTVRVLRSLGKTVQLTHDVIVCDGCLLTRDVFRLA